MINENLKSLRKIHQYTQEELAEKLNVSRQSIAKWESGVSQTKGYYWNNLCLPACREKNIAIKPEILHKCVGISFSLMQHSKLFHFPNYFRLISNFLNEEKKWQYLKEHGILKGEFH